MGLEADRVEVLLLELLYKTDYSNDFDREVRVPSTPLICTYLFRDLGGGGTRVHVLACVYLYLSLYRLLSPWLGFPEGRHPVLWPVCPGPGEDSTQCASRL